MLVLLIPVSSLHSYIFDYAWFFKTVPSEPSLDNVKLLTFTPHDQESSTHEYKAHDLCYALENNQFSTGHIQLSDTTKIEVTESIPSEQDEIVIYVPSYNGFSNAGRHRYSGAAAYETYCYYKNNLIHVPCVTFCAPTHYRKTFNMGQAQDQKYLDLVIQAVKKKNPKASITLMGVCHGATALLNYMSNPDYAESMKDIKAVVMESPSLSLDALVEHTARKQVPWGLRWIVPRLFKFLLTGYTWSAQTLLHTEKVSLPQNLAIFMGYLQHDDTVNPDHNKQMIKKLQSVCQHVSFYASKDTKCTHGKLGMDSAYQAAVNLFFKKYGLKYNMSLL